MPPRKSRMSGPLDTGGSALNAGGRALGTPSSADQARTRRQAQRRTAQQLRTGTYERGEAGRAYLRAIDRIPDGPPFRTTGGVEWYMNVFGRVIEYPPSHVTDSLRGTVDLAELTEWWIIRFVGVATETHADDFQADADMLIADMYSNWSDDQRIAVMRMGFAKFRADLSRRTKEYQALDEATKRTVPEPWGWYHSSRR